MVQGFEPHTLNFCFEVIKPDRTKGGSSCRVARPKRGRGPRDPVRRGEPGRPAPSARAPEAAGVLSLLLLIMKTNNKHNNIIIIIIIIIILLLLLIISSIYYY